MKYFNWPFLILPISLLTSGCIENQAQLEYAAIPSIRTACHSAQSAGCTANKAGTDVLVGLTSNPVDCAAYLANQRPQESFAQMFDASGRTPVTTQGAFLVGTVAEWVNFGNVRVYDLPKRTYKVCAFLDLSNDQRWQNTEPIAVGEASVGGAQVVIDDWL